MKRGVFKSSALSVLGTAAKTSAFTIAAVAAVLYGVRQAEDKSVSEGRKILEDGLRRAAATCYAIEGVYPESLSYIKENYGIVIDTKYTVFYEVLASNVFPEITVLETEEGF